MSAAFVEEWKLYRDGTAHPPFVAEPPRAEGEFDAYPKVGELRIFADLNRPLVALAVRDCGLSGMRFVPVSPFASIASRREAALDGRVYQLWNACVLSRTLCERSWLVDTLADEETEEIRLAAASIVSSEPIAVSGAAAEYEREFMLAGGSLQRWLDDAVERPNRFELGWSSVNRIACRIAAVLAVVLCGWYFLGEGTTVVRQWKELRTVRLGADSASEPIELVEPADMDDEPMLAECEAAASEAMDAIGGPCRTVPDMPRPVVGYRKPETMVNRCTAPVVMEFERSVLPKGFVSSEMASASCLQLKKLERGTSPYESNHVAAAPSALSDGTPSAVRCRLAGCPWNERHCLLNLSAPEMNGVRVTVSFDPRAVVGYRLVSGGDAGPLNAYYEIVPRHLGSVSTKDISVFVRWETTGGSEYREEPVKPADESELKDLPQLPAEDRQTPSASPGDIPVRVSY